MEFRSKLLFVLFLTCSLEHDVVSAAYLTSRIEYDLSPVSSVSKVDNATNTYRHEMEFWPDYAPLKAWVVDGEGCPSDVRITYRSFDVKTLKDYDGLARGIVPSLDLRYFRGKTFMHFFENAREKNVTCHYDSAWFDPPSRFYGFHGFRTSTYDSHHDFTYASYASVPFVRHVDATFVDERTWNTVHVSNNWYYAFERHGRYVQQGRLGDLWAGLPLQKGFVDSVLVAGDKTLCFLLDDEIQCHPFDPVTRRYRTGNAVPVKFREVYRGGAEDDDGPRYPWKGSFWVPSAGETAFLDSNDVFWIYDVRNEWIASKPFCEFMGFGKLHCCDSRKSERPEENVEDEHDFGGGVTNVTSEEEEERELTETEHANESTATTESAETETGYTTAKLSEVPNETNASRVSEEWNQFVSSIFGGFAL